MIGSIILMALVVGGVATTAYVLETNQESTAVISHAGTANAYLNVSAEEIQRVVRWAELIAEREAAKRGLSDAERDVLREQFITSELADYLKTRGIYSVEPRVLEVYAQNTSEATTHLTGNLQLALTTERAIVQSRNFSCTPLRGKYYCYPNSSDACTFAEASNECQLRVYKERGYTCLAEPLPVQRGSWSCLKLKAVRKTKSNGFGGTYSAVAHEVELQKARSVCEKRELEAQGYSCYSKLTPVREGDYKECTLRSDGIMQVASIVVSEKVKYEEVAELYTSMGGRCVACYKPRKFWTAWKRCGGNIMWLRGGVCCSPF